MRLFLAILALLPGLNVCISQDLHFGQFSFHPVFFQPTYSATTPANLELGGIYRSQWQSIPVPYNSMGIYGTMNTLKKVDQKFWFGLGLAYSQDHAGDGNLVFQEPLIQGSVAAKLRKGVISLGVTTGFSKWRLTNSSAFRFDKQYVDFAFANSNPSGEQSIFSNPDGQMPLSTGISYGMVLPRGKWSVALAANNLLRRDPRYTDAPSLARPIRYTGQIEWGIKISNSGSIEGEHLIQFQEPYQESAHILGYRFQPNIWKRDRIGLFLGGMIRPNDAFGANLRIQKGAYEGGLLYEINNSNLRPSTRGQGAWEIALRYRYAKVKKVTLHKICPLE
jgi:type IX secretion system PorP/SprF family membrane protein